LFEDLHHAPALGGRKRPGLHDQHPVTDAALVLLVVSLELVVAAHDLAVEGVLDTVLDSDHDGLVHLVADDQALTDLAGVALVVLAHASSFSPVRIPSLRSLITV